MKGLKQWLHSKPLYVGGCKGRGGPIVNWIYRNNINVDNDITEKNNKMATYLGRASGVSCLCVPPASCAPFLLDKGLLYSSLVLFSESFRPLRWIEFVLNLGIRKQKQWCVYKFHSIIIPLVPCVSSVLRLLLFWLTNHFAQANSVQLLFKSVDKLLMLSVKRGPVRVEARRKAKEDQEAGEVFFSIFNPKQSKNIL